MKLDGKEIASHIYENLKKRVGKLQKKGITPHLAVILVGDNPSSKSYVAQKQKWAENINAKVTITHFDETVSNKTLKQKVEELNEDPTVHAILIQRPLPNNIDVKKLELLTNPQKDIDGFHHESP